MLGHDLYWEGKNSKPDPPLLPLASWLRLGIAKGPRRPVRPWVQVAPRHLLHSNLSDANTRFDENILSRIFRVVGRRASIHPCKKTLSLFYLLADGATFLPTEIVSLLSIRKMEECIFHSNYRDSRKKISRTWTYPRIKKIYYLLNENFLLLHGCGIVLTATLWFFLTRFTSL